jgi:hypothetical protein
VIKTTIACVCVCFVTSSVWFLYFARSVKSPGDSKSIVTGVACDSGSFIEFAKESEKLRVKRRINAHQFASMARDTNTIVLDARSEAAHELLRMVGSINLPYTSFSEASLREIIPTKETKILIYCRNNFSDVSLLNHGVDLINFESGSLEAKHSGKIKGRAVGLNVPTYITLFVYGYKNVYELEDVVYPFHSPIQFAGIFFERHENERLTIEQYRTLPQSN